MSDFYPTSESGRSSESYASDPVQRAIERGLVLPAEVGEVVAWLREQIGGDMKVSALGVTGSRSKVLHIPASEPRRWSALCHGRGGRRFLVTIADADAMRRSFPDRRLCRQCERVLAVGEMLLSVEEEGT